MSAAHVRTLLRSTGGSGMNAHRARENDAYGSQDTWYEPKMPAQVTKRRTNGFYGGMRSSNGRLLKNSLFHTVNRVRVHLHPIDDKNIPINIIHQGSKVRCVNCINKNAHTVLTRVTETFNFELVRHDLVPNLNKLNMLEMPLHFFSRYGASLCRAGACDRLSTPD